MFVPLSWAYPDATSAASCMHVLPKGFHRIRHYGLFASGNRVNNIAQARKLLAVPKPASSACRWWCDRSPACDLVALSVLRRPMIIIETFARGSTPRHRPTTTDIKIDTS